MGSTGGAAASRVVHNAGRLHRRGRILHGRPVIFRPVISFVESALEFL
jgi:hypothetical protein